VNNAPRDIVTADVDADDVLDLVVLQSFDVSVLVGNGDGTFVDERQFAAAPLVTTHSVRAGDVNVDGAMDLIVASDDLNIPEFLGDVSILFNQIDLQDPFGIAPIVTMTSPVAGASAVVGTFVTLSADATDDIAVARVEFLVDESVFFADTIAPYSFSLLVPSGMPTLALTARAVDLGGTVGASAPVALTVLNDQTPVVSITSPLDGDTLTEGSVTTASVAATDDIGVVSVDLFVDGLLTDSDFGSPFTFELAVPTGVSSLTIGAQATDTAGHVGVAADVVVNVEPDPGTTVVGIVVDSGGVGFEGATVIAEGESSTTLADGSFTIPSVPTAPGDIVVRASFTSGTEFLSAMSAPTPPVPGGTTNVGVLMLRADLLFSIDFGSTGVVGSAVEDARGTGLSPTNIWRSSQDSTNVLEVTGSDLGLVAFTPSNIDGIHVQSDGSLLFTVNSDAQGAPGSAVEAATGGGLLEANIYRSLRDGTNELFLSGAAIGLEPSTGSDVNGITLSPDGSILFTVNFGAVGVVGSAVEAAAGSGLLEINIYRSTGDGTNELFLSGAALGIVPGTSSNVNGVIALGDGSIAFTTIQFSAGVAGSALEAALGGGFLAANLYRSTGDGTNEPLISGGALGLEPGDVFAEVEESNIDALSLP